MGFAVGVVVLAAGAAIYWVPFRIAAKRQNEVAVARDQGRELARLRTENDRLVRESANDLAAVADLREEVAAAAMRATAAERVAAEARAATAPAAVRPGVALVAGLKPIGNFENAGKATARAAFETRGWAAQGGDVDLVADTMVLLPATRQKAEELFARLPEEKQAQFGTPERLLATLFAGTSGGPQTVGAQVLAEQSGAKIAGMEEAINDPAYKTLHVQTQYSNGVVRESDAVFQQTGDGWRAVVQPNTIAKAGGMLGLKLLPTTTPRPNGGR